MDIVLYIAASIALLAVAALFIYLITFFRETKALVANTNTTLNELSARVNDQLRNVDGIMKNVNALTDDISTVVDDTTTIIHEGQKIIVSIMELEQTLQKSIQEPIVETVSILSALGKGIRAVRLKLAGSIDHPVGAEIAGLSPQEVAAASPPPRYAEPSDSVGTPHLEGAGGR